MSFYSKSTGGFYTREKHGDEMPEDVVEITTEEHIALLDAEAAGKVIKADADGKPAVVDPAPPTVEQIISSLTGTIQQRLDDFARTRGYDGILSACTYAVSSIQKFQAEGQACVDARDATWGKCYEILAEVKSGKRPMPSLDEIAAELPELVWPT